MTFGSAMGYVLLAPLILISLYFENWFHKVQRRIVGIGTLIVLLALAFFWAMRPADVPLVYPVTHSAWINWPLGIMAARWPVGSGDDLPASR